MIKNSSSSYGDDLLCIGMYENGVYKQTANAWYPGYMEWRVNPKVDNLILYTTTRDTKRGKCCRNIQIYADYIEY